MVGSNTRRTRYNRPRGVRLGGISFSCPNASGPILGGVGLAVRPCRGVTLINCGNTNGAALAGLLLELCSIDDNRVLVNKGDVGSRSLRSRHDEFTTIFRSFRLFTTALNRGITLSDRVSRPDTIGTLRGTNFSGGLRGKVGAPLLHRFSRGKVVLSNNRTRGTTVTETFCGRYPCIVVSRPSTGLSPVTRCGLGLTVRGTTGGGAIIFVSRELSAAIKTSGVCIVRGNRVTRDNARTRLVRTNNGCTCVFGLRTGGCETWVSGRVQRVGYTSLHDSHSTGVHVYQV